MPVDLSVPQFIISSMMAAKQLRQQKARDQASIEAQGAETDLKRQQHDQQKEEFGEMLKHLKIQNESELAKIDAQRAQTKALHQTNQISLLNAYRAGGIVPTGTTQTSLGDAMSNKMNASMFTQSPAINIGGENISLAGGVSPDQANQQEADKIRATGAATSDVAAQTTSKVSAAQDPWLAADEQRKSISAIAQLREKSKLEAENEMAKLVQQGHSAERIANIHGQYALAGDRITAGAHLEGVRIAHEFNIAPDTLNSVFDSVQSGQTDINKLPKEEKILIQNMFGKLHWEIPNQKHLESVAAAKGVEELMNQYMDLAKNYSKDSPGRGVIANFGSANSPFGDLQRKQDALKSQGGQLASFFDKQQRKSDPEILRQGKGLFSPYSTVQQNLDAINSHMRSFNEIIGGALVGMPADQKNDILRKNGINTFGGYSTDSNFADKLPATNEKGHKLNKELSNRLNRPIYEDQ